jgi:(2Fe-2S) ferredoxin
LAGRVSYSADFPRLANLETHMADDPRLFYDHHIFMCTNVRPEGHPRGCCSAGGSEKLRGYMREKARAMGIENIRCNASGCLDRCELGPNMVIYPEGVWYHYENTQDIDEILETHVKNGGRVQRLMLQPDQLPPKH